MLKQPIFFCEDLYGKDFWKPMMRILLINNYSERERQFSQFRFVHFNIPSLKDPNKWQELIENKGGKNAWKIYFIIDFDKISQEIKHEEQINLIKNQLELKSIKVEFFLVKNCLESIICRNFTAVKMFVKDEFDFEVHLENCQERITRIFEENNCHKQFLKNFFKNSCIETYKESIIPKRLVNHINWEIVCKQDNSLSNFISDVSNYWNLRNHNFLRT